MNKAVISELVRLNNEFYTLNAASFSATRVKPWDGWVRGVAEIFPEILSSNLQNSTHHKGLKVLDFAAGNGRFENYLLSQTIADNNCKMQITAVDNCDSLLLDAKTQRIDADAKFIKSDIITSLLSGEPLIPAENQSAKNPIAEKSADLVVSFGFLHHIPSYDLRLKFIREMLNYKADDGYLFISLWNFANTDDEIQKSTNYTNDYFVSDYAGKFAFSEEDLEQNDYLLGWKNEENAFRYCHNFDENEIMQISAELEDLDYNIINKFTADGKDNNQNWYLAVK